MKTLNSNYSTVLKNDFVLHSTHTEMCMYIIIKLCQKAPSQLTLSLSHSFSPSISLITPGRSLRMLSVITNLMYLNLCWSANTSISMLRSLLEKLNHDFILYSLAVYRMSLSHLHSLWDGRQVAVQKLFCGVLLPDVAFLCTSHLAFYLSISLESMSCLFSYTDKISVWLIAYEQYLCPSLCLCWHCFQ